MEHQHKYDAQGKQLCCTQEEKIYNIYAGASELLKKSHSEHDGHNHEEQFSDDDGHDHSGGNESTFKMFLPAIISLVLLLLAIGFDNYFPQTWFTGWVRIIWYAVAYLPVGFPVIKEAITSIGKGEIFSEFLLMSIATWCFCHWRISRRRCSNAFLCCWRSVSNFGSKKSQSKYQKFA
jgi:Cd2+/Zn2+-exporting ATPase